MKVIPTVVELAITKLVTGDEFVENVKKVRDKVWSSPPAELENNHQWFQCTIRNATQFQIHFEEAYWESGKFWESPNTVQGFDDMTFSLCNSDDSISKGPAGGFVFSISLNEEHKFYFSLGLITLANRQHKPGLAGFIESEFLYKIKDKDDNQRCVYFHIKQRIGKEMQIEVIQIFLRE
ncbi:hypothetical protein FSST1_012811 [Fusarium sambucinum]